MDSLIHAHIDFSTPLEKELYEQCRNGDEKGFLKLMLASDLGVKDEKLDLYLTRVEAQVDRIVKGRKGRLDKNVQYLFDELHEAFLKVYSLEARSSEIFSTGTYNCLTASALYALALKKMDIPFNFCELPTHIFIIVDPNGERIILETTDPVNGVIVPTQKFKKQYIEALAEQKMIRREDLDLLGWEVLFDQVYYGNDKVSIREMVGLHYYNRGIYAHNKEDAISTANEFRKAYALYPSESISVILLSALGAVTYLNDHSQLEHFDDIADAYNLSEPNADNLMRLENEMKYFAGRYLEKTYKPEFFDELHQRLSDNLVHSEFINVLDGVYNYERARSLMLNRRFSEGMPYVLEALKYMPEAPALRNMFAICLIDKFVDLGGASSMIPYMDSLVGARPEFDTSGVGEAGYLYAHLLSAGDNFEKGNIEAAESSMGKFEKIHQGSNFVMEPDIIAAVYIEAWKVAVQQDNMDEAKKIIKRGLERAPNNESLLYHLSHHD